MVVVHLHLLKTIVFVRMRLLFIGHPDAESFLLDLPRLLKHFLTLDDRLALKLHTEATTLPVLIYRM